MAVKNLNIRYVYHRSFTTKTALAQYGETELPPLPSCPVYEPNATSRPSSTYVMSRDEERQRFLEWNYAKVQAKLAKDTRTQNKWLKRAKHLREYLTRVNMPLIYSQVARNQHRLHYIDWSEGISEATAPLMRALDSYDVERQCKFSTYAVRAILNCLSRANMLAAKRSNRISTVELPEAYGEEVAVIDDPLADEKELLGPAMASLQLTKVEATVLKHRYALGGAQQLTLEAVGDIIGVSKERVRQIQNKLLGRLREAMAVAAE